MSHLKPATIKRGDTFCESEYGSTIFGLALQDAEVNEEENYWTFWALMSDGRKVHYRGQLKNTAYNPDIMSINFTDTTFVNFNIDDFDVPNDNN